MPENNGIQVVWDNGDKTIIRWDFGGNWTWNDFYAAVRQSREMRATVEDRLDVPSILNFKNSGTIPVGALSHARTALEIMNARDYTVVAESSGYARALTEVFIRFNPSARSKILITDTVDQARSIIAARSGLAKRA